MLEPEARRERALVLLRTTLGDMLLGEAEEARVGDLHAIVLGVVLECAG